MTAFIILGCVFILSILLFFWGDHRMQKAMSSLKEVSDIAQAQLKEAEMACKCQEIKTKDPSIPCAEPKEESFRVAFMNETRKAARFSAEKQELERRLNIYEKVSFETVRKLDLHIQSLEQYAKTAVEALPSEIGAEFVKKYGNPPTSLRLGNGS